MITYRRLAIAGLLGLAILASAGAAGVVVNTTRSLPLGLYLARSAPVQPGADVFWCPPDQPAFREALARGYLASGPCPGGFAHMLKRVAAVSGDRIDIAADGLRVNGVLWPLSAPRAADPAERPLAVHPVAHFTLAPGEVLLMGVTANSWDARYYGPVARVQLQTVVPLLTW